jgi:murein DD-endopeptidase MepM/ murein hydrolase activator NlpD
MGTPVRTRRGVVVLPGIIALLGLLAACVPWLRGPAPVVYGGAARSAVSLAMPPLPGRVVVQPGQSLSVIASTYHISWPALAAANHLVPPYRVMPGQILVMPTAGAYAAAPPPLAVASLPPPKPVMLAPPSERPQPAASGPSERPRPATARSSPTRSPPRVIPLDSSAGIAARSARSPVVATAQAPPRAAPSSAASGQSFERPIPLDNPAARSAARSKPSERHEVAAGERGAEFIWPVRGPIIEGFGAGPDGTHNEGINIAALRNTPVRATAGGVVVYVGNQLRGYGNLILIKHPKGWISAYAHCGAVLVERGQRVHRGQVIARVGATGDVSQPQLHFELRQGEKAVDPRLLLGAPAKAAEAGRARAS